MDLIGLIQSLTGENFHKWKILIIFLLASLLFFTATDPFLSQFLTEFVYRACFYLLILICFFSFWACNKWHLPRNKKGKVGIIIAIFTENEQDRIRLKSDFVRRLKDEFRKEGLLNLCEIIFLKNHFAEKIVESDNPSQTIDLINKKIKGHLYLWGKIVKRKDGEDEQKYFLEFKGRVFHAPIPVDLSNKMAKDFAKVLVKDQNFLESREFEGFRASTKNAHLATKYMIGIAAFVSSDPITALKMHKNLKEQFNSIKPLPEALRPARDRIPLLISDELYWIALWHLENGRINDAKQNLSISLSENNKNYSSWILKSIIDFDIDKNIEESFKSLHKASSCSNGNNIWLYNKAFLLFWKEDYKHALRACLKIRKNSFFGEVNILNNIKKFNLKKIDQYTNKGQLYFWIGYLSYFKEENLPEALNYFTKFEEVATPKMNELKQKSSAYLINIKKIIGY